MGEMGEMGTDETIPQSSASEFGCYFVCHRSPVTDLPVTFRIARLSDIWIYLRQPERVRLLIR